MRAEILSASFGSGETDVGAANAASATILVTANSRLDLTLTYRSARDSNAVFAGFAGRL